MDEDFRSYMVSKVLGEHPEHTNLILRNLILDHLDLDALYVIRDMVNTIEGLNIRNKKQEEEE